VSCYGSITVINFIIDDAIGVTAAAATITTTENSSFNQSINQSVSQSVSQSIKGL